VMGGALWSTKFRNQVSGVPNRTTAATCGAIAGGIGPVIPAGRANPAGTVSVVAYRRSFRVGTTPTAASSSYADQARCQWRAGDYVLTCTASSPQRRPQAWLPTRRSRRASPSRATSVENGAGVQYYPNCAIRSALSSLRAHHQTGPLSSALGIERRRPRNSHA
jgi:hypothetical protein